MVYRRNCFAWLWLITMLIPRSASAEMERTRVIAFENGHFYFPLGSDQYVVSSSRFYLKKDSVIVLEGAIEAVTPAVCYSTKVDSVSLSPAWETLDAYISVAEIDSTRSVYIMSMDLDSLDLNLLFSQDTLIFSESSFVSKHPKGNEVSITPILEWSNSGWSQAPKADSFELMLSYHATPVNNRGAQRRDFEAPFMAVIVPNLSSPANRDGLLTTSLYYRFDHNRLPVLWDGDSPGAQFSIVGSKTLVRSYPFDSKKGKKLLEESKRPKKVAIKAASTALEQAAYYFADVLSRDKVRVGISNTDDKADIILTFIPFDSTSPLVSLRYLHDLLVKQNPQIKSQKETIDIIGNYLQAALADSSRRDHYIQLAEQSFVSDLGVFPLFRPRIYLSLGELVRMETPDSLSTLSLKNLIIHSPPPADSEVIRDLYR